MRRREFISLVGAMAAAWPPVARAEQAGIKRSSLLMSAAQSDPEETFSDGYRKSIITSRKTTGTCRLTPEEFHSAYPKLRAWIQKTLALYEENAKPVASHRHHFRRHFRQWRRPRPRSIADVAPERCRARRRGRGLARPNDRIRWRGARRAAAALRAPASAGMPR